MKAPLSIETVTNAEGAREIYKYSRINIFIENGIVVGWKETEAVHPDPLNVSFAALQRAIELDTQKRLERQIRDNLTRLNNLVITHAVLKYQDENFAESFRFFEIACQISELPLSSHIPVDSAIYFNTGLVASFAKKHQEAIKYFEKAKNINYGGANIYILIKDQHIALGDSAKALEVLQAGFSKFPSDNVIVIDLINYYITSGKSIEALNYLEVAKKLEPTNASLYFAEGFLHERLGDIDKARSSYILAIEKDPVFFDALYNLGGLYYNDAVRQFEIANDIMDNKKFQVARDAAIATLAKAVPYLERAHEVNPNEIFVLETLRVLYFRLQMTDKLKIVEEKLSKLRQ